MNQLLENITEIIELEHDELELIDSVIRYRELEKREIILKPGQVCRSTIFVSKGCLRSYYLTDGDYQILEFAVDNWWIGDLKSFLRQTPSELFVDAVKETQILQISHQQLTSLYEKIPRLERFFRILTENALVAHQERILHSHTLSAKQRYELFIQKYPGFYNSIPLKDIANYLRITPEYLSSLRGLRA